MPTTLFQKGLIKSPQSGRKLGTPNKVTIEQREFAKRFCESDVYRANLLARILKGEANHMELYLNYYAFGNPKDRPATLARTHEPFTIPVER